MIIFIIPYVYPDLHNPSGGSFIKAQAEGLAETGNDVIVLNATPLALKKLNLRGILKTEIKKQGEISVITLKSIGILSSKFPRTACFLYNISLNRIFKHAVKKFGKPDVLYSHFSFPSGICALKYSKKYNIKLVNLEHYSLFLRSKLNYYYKNLLLKLLNNSVFLCVSEFLKNNIIKHVGINKQITVLPNPIDDVFKFSKRTKKDRFTFLSAGNFVSSKGFEELIKAFCIAFKFNDKVILKIAGSGVLENSINNLIKQNKRENQIEIVGRLDKKQMFELYKECDVFVLNSEKETFSIVCREAMAVGRPVISRKNGGAEENFSDDFGLLIDNDKNEKTLADALIKIYNNYSDYDLEKISKSALTLYNKNKIMNQLNEILNFY